jgi:hypothetical protein
MKHAFILGPYCTVANSNYNQKFVSAHNYRPEKNLRNLCNSSLYLGCKNLQEECLHSSAEKAVVL